MLHSSIEPVASNLASLALRLHVQISWQAQHFVNLHVQNSWQAQHFANFHAQSSWQAQHFVNLDVQISWQAHYFVNLLVQISWQAQHFVNLHASPNLDAEAPQKVARRCRDHGRIMLGIVRPL